MCMSVKQVWSLTLIEGYKECVKEEDARQEKLSGSRREKGRDSRKLHKENLVAFYRVF